VIIGSLSLVFGAGAIWFAAATYRAGQDLSPFTGGLRGQDYPMILTLTGFGVIYLIIGYVLIARSRADSHQKVESAP
jgi:hypothetical protein